MFIDSHCHLLSNEYEDVDNEIEKAIKSGVKKIIINGYDVESSTEAVELSKKYKEVYAAVGIGPENITDVTDEDIKKIEMLANNPKVVAIGEIGLDYYWTKDNKEEQIYVLKNMLAIAKKHNLPVIVHNREATLDIYDYLKEYNVIGIMHCFSGSIETARKFIELGFLLGIGGVVTFKNAKKIKEVVKEIPLTSISLETDSPYLTPEPHRGKKNNPDKLIYIAQQIAEIKEATLEEVASQTSQNVAIKFDL